MSPEFGVSGSNELHNLISENEALLSNVWEDFTTTNDTFRLAFTQNTDSEQNLPFLPISSSQWESNLQSHNFSSLPYLSSDRSAVDLSSAPPSVNLPMVTDLPQPSFEMGLSPKNQDSITSFVDSHQSMHSLNHIVEEDSITRTSMLTPSVETRLLKDHMQTFIKLAPSFNKINGKNFSSLLIQVLRRCLHHIPLDDFFNMLFNSNTFDDVISLPVDGTKLDKSITSKSKLESVRLCRLVLETFRQPNFLRDILKPLLIQNVLLFSIKFHEILRTFFAIKVVFDIIKVSDSKETDSRLAKISVFKAYYIICKQLTRKYPKESKYSELEVNLILSHSQFGKVMRSVFPNLILKRLGTRKSSTFHYMHIEWNNIIIDEKIKQLIELSLPDLDKHFNYRKAKVQKPHSSLTSSLDAVPLLNLESNVNVLPVALSNQKPIHSFVDYAYKFPAPDCCIRGRFQGRIPGRLPEQSLWSKKTIANSVMILKTYKFDIEPLLVTLDRPSFCARSVETFFQSVLVIIHLFIESSAPNKVYLNFYLVVSLLITPMALASNAEVTLECKHQFRILLTNFVSRLERDYTGLSSVNYNNLMSFVKIMRKIISCNKVSLSQVDTPLVKSIVRVFGREGHCAGDPNLVLALRKRLMTLIQRCVIAACNALNWEFLDESLRTDLKYQARFTQEITDRYLNFCLNLSKGILSIPSQMTDEDHEEPKFELAYHICRQLSQVFHGILMSDDFMIKLPIKLIEMMVNSITNEIQNINFHRFGNLEHELASQTFKTWWVYSTAVQEYIGIISEIAALSTQVS